MMMYKRTLVQLLLIIAILIPTDVKARELSKRQQERADIIADICEKEWDEYGVLPSVCIAQAFVESTLGEHCPNYNLWGICSGAVRYNSLSDGVYGYMKVINNGYYKDAPFCTDYKKQIRHILDGGYCQPEGDYYHNAIWTIEHYHLDKYDQKMFKHQRKKKQEQTFIIKYKKSVNHHSVAIDKSIVKSGCVGIEIKLEIKGLYDVLPGGKDNIIYSSNKKLSNKKVKLVVFENAKG